MEEIDEGRRVQILAAEAYLHARMNMLPKTVIYVYESTYNYLFTKIKRYV